MQHDAYTSPKLIQNRAAISNSLGATLIEALISLLVFSVGALGLAAMQLSVLSVSGDSQQRTMAMWKAQELADRIRANSSIAELYVTRVNRQALTTIGVDTNAGVVACGSGIFATPSSYCSDRVGNSSACGIATDDTDKVAYDIWEVFCDPSSGAAVAAGSAADGTVGLTNLEIVLRQNTVAADGNDDMEIYLEWLSREADATESIKNSNGSANNVQTDLCGRDNVNIDSRLGVYCLRFRP